MGFKGNRKEDASDAPEFQLGVLYRGRGGSKDSILEQLARLKLHGQSNVSRDRSLSLLTSLERLK